MLIDANTKVYEKPESGDYIGRIADVVDYVEDQPRWGKKNVPVLRLVWVLNANDTEGKPFRVAKKYTASMHEKSNLYSDVKSILGTAPPVPFESEDLIGKCNRLVIEQEENDGRVYANIRAILKMLPGAVAPSVPADFVRAKDRPAQTNGTRAYAAPAVQAAKAPAPQAAKPAPQPQSTVPTTEEQIVF